MTIKVHGTAVEINNGAVLLIGPSGAGKSDLALRLIDRGAKLVGDDAVTLHDPNGVLVISGVGGYGNRMEVRGVGIFDMEASAKCPLRLLVELGTDGERLPASWPLRDLHSWSLPVLRLDAFAASAPIKVELALQSVVDEALHPVRLPVAS
ncbi:MAG: HPr kinase/phosphatase C-terminal domain-containing protein [Sphingorhabdus sp.]